MRDIYTYLPRLDDVTTRREMQYVEKLKSKDGGRSIWTRVFFDDGRTGIPIGAMLALTVEGTNLMVANYKYARDGALVPERLTLGVAGPDKLIRWAGDDYLTPWHIYLFSTPTLWGHFWKPTGSIGFDEHMKDRYEGIISQGFFRLDDLTGRLDVPATMHKFLEQVTGYIQNPVSFEPQISPKITPELVRRV